MFTQKSGRESISREMAFYLSKDLKIILNLTSER